MQQQQQQQTTTPKTLKTPASIDLAAIMRVTKRARSAPVDIKLVDRIEACNDYKDLATLLSEVKLIDPSKKITHNVIETCLVAQEKAIQIYAKKCGITSPRFVRRRTLWRSVASTIAKAAMKLLPVVSVHADYFLALSRDSNPAQRPPAENESVNVGTQDEPIIERTHDSVSAPRLPVEIRNAIGLLEERANDEDGIPRHVEMCERYIQEEIDAPDIEADALALGDIAIPPCMISAPMRKGKTDVSLVLIWFLLLMGFRVTYGVAPNKSAVIKPVWSKLMSMGWHDPEFGLLIDPIATYKPVPSRPDQLSVTAQTLDAIVAAKASNFLIYSIDQAKDAKAAYNFIKASTPSFEVVRPSPDCHNDDASVRISYDDEHGRPCANIRDEAQNAARSGSEDKREKLQKKKEEERAANRAVRVATAAAAGKLPSSREVSDAERARARYAQARSALDKAEASYEKAKSDLVSWLRKTFPNSMGISTNITATNLPTVTEQQMWGTSVLGPVPLGVLFALDEDPEVQKKGIRGQSFEVVPALTPNSDTFYRGFNKCRSVAYGDIFTKEVVYNRYKTELKAYLARRVSEASDDAARDACVADLKNWKALAVPIQSPLFENASFARTDILKLKGSKTVKATAKTLVDASKFLAWIDVSAVGVARQKRVVPPEEHAPLDATAPPVLPTTIVMVTDKISTKSAFVATQLTVAKRIVDILIERNQNGLVAVWGSDMKESNIKREFPSAEFVTTFGASAMRNVACFHVRGASTGGVGVLDRVHGNVDDFAEVVDRLADGVDRDELENTNIFCVGYAMFTGAITLTHTVYYPDDSELVVCPGKIAYAHTLFRQIDAKCQAIGRGFNDASWQSDLSIDLLSHANTETACRDYMKSETIFVSTTQQPRTTDVDNGDGTTQTELCRDENGFVSFPSLYYCITAASKKMQASTEWRADEKDGLAKANLGLKAAHKRKAKVTLGSAIADHFDREVFEGDLSDASDDDEVAENAETEAGATLPVLPPHLRHKGKPYLHSCAIEWLREKFHVNGSLKPSTQRDYVAKFSEVINSREFLEHGGWKAHLPDSIKGTDLAEFDEIVLEPFYYANHPGSQIRNYRAPFTRGLYRFWKGSVKISEATPEDFGYRSLDAILPILPSSASQPMDTTADNSDSDPDYTPSS